MDPSLENPSPDRAPLEDREIISLWRNLRDFVRRRVRARDQAEDIVQESLLRALSSSPNELRSTQAWLRVVAQRLILDEARSSRRRVARERVAARPEHVPPVDAELASRVEVAMRYVAELREPYREVVLLRYRDGLDAGEIADRLGRANDTVRAQLKRGLDLLRERLGAERAEPKRRRMLAILPWLTPAPARASSTASRAVARWGMWAAAVCVATLVGTWLWHDSRAAQPHDALVAITAAREGGTPLEIEGLSSVEADLGPVRTNIARTVDSTADAFTALAPDSRHSVRGRVFYRPDGTPIVGATILAASEGLEQVTRLGASSERGEFDVTLPGLPVWIWAEHDHYSSTTRRLVDRGFAESREPLVLDAIRSGQIKGVVVDERGEPVPRARLVFDIPVQTHALRDAHGMLISQPPSIVATTNDEGCFAAAALPGRIRVTVTADGFGTQTSVGVLQAEPMLVALSRDDVAARGSQSRGDLVEAAESGVSSMWTQALPEPGIHEAASHDPPTLVAAGGSIRARLESTTELRGPALELRLDGDRPVSLRRTQRDEHGDFEFQGLPPGEYTLSVEGGGVHGAWIIAKMHLDAGERRDLGLLRTPVPGSVFVQALSAIPGETGPATFSLVGERSTLRAHYRTQGLGIDIDRVASTIAIRAVWPGAYRMLVEGGKISTASAACDVREGCETRLALEIEPALHTFVSVKLARPLREGERWSVFLHSPEGLTEVESMDTRFHPLPDGTLTFNTGVTPDVESIEVRTSLGMSGELCLTRLPAESRRDLQIELR